MSSNGHTNGAAKHPSQNPSNGRDEKGRFAPGGPGGPGNPHAKKVHKIRSMFLDAATPARVTELIELLWSKALHDQEQWAIQEVLNRLYGKPKETIKIEESEDQGDAFDLLSDEETRLVLTRAHRRRQASGQVAGPGSSSC